MANRYAGKSKPVRKSVGFSREEWREIRKWIAEQRPKISESEGLRRLVAWYPYAVEALESVASEQCCQTEGCSIEDPHCSTMVCKAALAMRQESERAAK